MVFAGGCAQDNAFGPTINHTCRGGFDFSLLFEQAILSLLPSALFLLAFLARFAHLTNSQAKTVYSSARGAKLCTAIVFVALQLTLLVLWCLEKSTQTKVSVSAAAVNLVVALQFVALSWIEDERSVRPSSLLNIYLLFTLLLDSAQSRTLWLQLESLQIASVFSASIAVKVALLFLETHEKRGYLKEEYRELPPESTSSIVNRSFLWWINGLFKRGFRALIAFEDLYALDENLATSRVGEKVHSTWVKRKRPERRLELPWAVCRALWLPLLSAAFPRLCLIALTFSQPFLISRVLNLLNQSEDQATTNEGYGLIGATVLIYGGLAIVTLHYNQKLYRFITMFRGAMIKLIYDHALVIQDGLYDESAAITLMSTDVDRIAGSLITINECWARLIEVAIGIVLLALQLGWVCVMPLVIVLVASVGSTQIAKRIGGRQKIWVDAVQKRISLTSSMLVGMRSVKMMGLSRLLTSMVQERRVIETHRMAGYRWSTVWQNVVQNLPWALAPALTFTVYAIQATAQGTPSIGTTKAFTSLSIITLLTNPAAKLLGAVPQTVASIGCFDRIQKYLIAPVRQDKRRIQGPSSERSSVDHSSKSATATEIGLIHAARSEPKIDSPNGYALSVNNASVRLVESSGLVLQDISFSVSPGSLVMIVGPVASGKTTLLKAMLGEIDCGRGSFSVASQRIAYCAQTPWLPNATIRQTICGAQHSEDFDEKWYGVTLRACALDQDLTSLPNGDQTQVGSGSTILSGGQKHRVALARAVYARAEIVILDNVLSALDTITRKTILERLFSGKGLFKETGSTVLLVTHTTEDLVYADKILVLSGGRLQDEGTYNEVIGSVNDTMLPVGNESEVVAIETESEAGTQELDAKQEPSQPSNTNKLPDLKKATGDFTVYKYYFNSIGWSQALIFVLFVVLQVFCQSFSQIWLKWWTDVNGGQIALYISIYILLAILNSIGTGGYIWAILILISPSTARKLHYVLLKTVMRAPQSFFSVTDSGSILNRFSQDMTLIEGQLPVGVMVTVSNLFAAIAGAALIASGSSYMAATIPFLMVAIFAVQHVYLRTSRQLRHLDLEARSPVISHFTESINGLATIRAFGWQKSCSDENNRLVDLSQQPYYLLYCIQRWLNLVLDLIVAAEAVIVIGLAIGLRTSTSAGLLGISLNNVLSFNNSLSSLVSGWTILETSLSSIARLKNFEAEVKPEARDGEIQIPPEDWPNRGAIEFDRLTASHNSTTVALHNVSLKIEPGQKIGICGRTGSGKSSLIATLLRLLEIEAGKITIDSLDIAKIPRDIIRERLVTIPQDPLILIGSVRLNADPGGTNSDASIIKALERVTLWGQLQEGGGLDAEITSSTLSHGQQQLFALARAILKRGKILLLDEATSNVDADTDAIMREIIREEFAGCTILTVAHRLETILDSDVIAVVEEGRLVEVGHPQKLLKEAGRFSQLVKGLK